MMALREQQEKVAREAELKRLKDGIRQARFHLQNADDPAEAIDGADEILRDALGED